MSVRSRTPAMPKARPFAELKARVMTDPVRREHIATMKRAMKDALALGELRDRLDAAGQSGEIPSEQEAYLLRIVHEEDLYLSMLRGYVAELGGRLEVSVVFPDVKVILVPAEPS